MINVEILISAIIKNYTLVVYSRFFIEINTY